MNFSQKIKYIGVNDEDIDLFESQYKVEDGMSYNSYLITDEKCAVLDTVDRAFGEEWLAKLKSALDGRTPDYLIVHHMEPDHSANIDLFCKEFPSAAIVATEKAFSMMRGFFGTDYSDRRRIVTDGDKLSLGEHTLTFITAPMVHWPEVAVSYEESEGILFSADAFGKFGAVRENERFENWVDEARRYYIGIVGKYGVQVQSLLKKASALDIRKICPLHGPVLVDGLDRYLKLYDLWSSYTPEEEGVVIACASVYGNTLAAARELEAMLRDRGVRVELYDLTRQDISAAVAACFKYSTSVFASSTYNGTAFPPMRELLAKLCERNFKKRRVAFIENGSWAPMAAKAMQNMLAEAKELEYAQCTVTVRSSLNPQSRTMLSSLAKELSGAAPLKA